MNFWEKFKRKCAREYTSSILIEDSSKKEKCKWMILVYGNRIDDLIPGDKQNIIPFEETHYTKTKAEAEEYGKVEFDKGHNVEIWKLIRRWK